MKLEGRINYLSAIDWVHFLVHTEVVSVEVETIVEAVLIGGDGTVVRVDAVLLGEETSVEGLVPNYRPIVFIQAGGHYCGGRRGLISACGDCRRALRVEGALQEQFGLGGLDGRGGCLLPVLVEGGLEGTVVLFGGFIDFDEVLFGEGAVLEVAEGVLLIVKPLEGEGVRPGAVLGSLEGGDGYLVFAMDVLLEGGWILWVLEGGEGEVNHAVKNSYNNSSSQRGPQKQERRVLSGQRVQHRTWNIKHQTSVIVLYQRMNSEFDVTVAFLQNVYKQASLDSQKLQADIRQLRDQMELLQKNIQSKTDAILREMNPRIEQLQQKMKTSWTSIEGMDRLSWEELEREKQIFANCEKIVKEMDLRIDEVQQRV